MLSLLVSLVNIVAVPLILFRFAIPWYAIPLVYVVSMGLFLVFSRRMLRNRSAKFARRFVLLGAPSFVSAVFLLNIPSPHPVFTESYAFEPKMSVLMDDWGRESLESTTMINLEGNAYESEVGIRIFINQDGFTNDTITYKMSKSVMGLKYVRSWEFH